MIYPQGKLENLHRQPFFLNSSENIGYVQLDNAEMHLLSSYDGTEVIRLKLFDGANWTTVPVPEWKGSENILITKGEVLYHTRSLKKRLKQGDFVSLSGLKDVLHLIPVGEAEAIYTVSSPLFQSYGKNIENIMSIAAQVEEKDGYTAEHCNRIKSFSLLLGEEMDLGRDMLYNLHFGAQLHDIGKLKIPDSILGKPAALTNEEWQIMRQHTLFGTEIIKDMNLPFLEQAIPIIEQHHERYNGSGYPFGLQKEEIHMGAAIVAVVDSYDAMTSERVYKKARPAEEAIEEIRRNREVLFHPDVVDVFMKKVADFSNAQFSSVALPVGAAQ